MNVRHASIGVVGTLLVASATAATVSSAIVPVSRYSPDVWLADQGGRSGW